MSIQFFQEQKTTRGSSIQQKAQKFADEASNVYELSMPLLANADLYQKNAARFESLLNETTSQDYKEDKAKAWMSSNEFRLWMRGRQLLTAMNAGKPAQASDIARKLQTDLTPETYASTSSYNPNSAFGGWALGYLLAYYALNDLPQYEENKGLLAHVVQYQQQRFEQLSSKEKQGFLSDVMWTYAMAIQASALAKDEDSFNTYMQGLAALSNPAGVANSIRQLPNDQFPAWLASIIHESAQRMPHAVSFRAEFIDARKRSTSEQDKMLGDATGIFYQQLNSSLVAKPAPITPQSKL